ncbi:MAG: hypothetical protein HUJ76_05955 [Parasporobacterium sp.]|nr:hypothetical protein [Parasporobacterium sp.]
MENQASEIKKRKLKSTLIICGRVTLLFAVWSLIKSILTIYLATQGIAENNWLSKLIPDQGTPEFNLLITTVLITVVIVVGLFLVVGLMAVKQGTGKKVRSWYLVLAGIMVAASLVSDIYTISAYAADTETLIDAILMVLVDLSSNVALVYIIAASVKLRKLEKNPSVKEV